MAKPTIAHLYHGRKLLIRRKKLAIEAQPHGWIARDYAELEKKISLKGYILEGSTYITFFR